MMNTLKNRQFCKQLKIFFFAKHSQWGTNLELNKKKFKKTYSLKGLKSRGQSRTIS